MNQAAFVNDHFGARRAIQGNAARARPSPGQKLLNNLLESFLIRPRDWERLDASVRDELWTLTEDELVGRLVFYKLINSYQASRVMAGTTHGVVLGNYRMLGRLGAGGMGVVFKAEHLHLPHLAAIKVLTAQPDQDTKLLRRFYDEVWAVGQLRHPNIVCAIDAGVAPPPELGAATLHYFVMEYVPGQDLEALVERQGPLSPIAACDLIHQVASALTESHEHQLVHRDIKPSNVLVTPEGQAKLLDFGLARHVQGGVTEMGSILGTLDYLAPEQAKDATSVDIRTDIYGLGGTMFWCLTGRDPFPSTGDPIQDVIDRVTQPPPLLRRFRPEASETLEKIISRMMAPNPDDRFASPEMVMHALLPLLQSDLENIGPVDNKPSKNQETPSPFSEQKNADAHASRVLLVDDETDIRSLCRYALEVEGIVCDEAGDGVRALEVLTNNSYDLVLLDVDMPEMNGTEVVRFVRQQWPASHLKIVMMSGRSSPEEMAQMMSMGADDYLTKPLSLVQLRSRIKAAIGLKQAQDRVTQLNHSLLELNGQLEHNLAARDGDLVHARNALVLALAELVTFRDIETSQHLVRLQRYCRVLADEAAKQSAFTDQIDSHFIQLLECCVPLHDIGKIGLPDAILSKPGKLTEDERIMMQTHTTMGAETLHSVAAKHGFSSAFFDMAKSIVRHHHERFDGKGYPDGLAGGEIPLPARLVTVADVYDALRSRRSYKPALSHGAALQVMLESCTGQFDPDLMNVFQKSAQRFEQIFRDVADDSKHD